MFDYCVFPLVDFSRIANFIIFSIQDGFAYCSYIAFTLVNQSTWFCLKVLLVIFKIKVRYSALFYFVQDLAMCLVFASFGDAFLYVLVMLSCSSFWCSSKNSSQMFAVLLAKKQNLFGCVDLFYVDFERSLEAIFSAPKLN